MDHARSCPEAGSEFIQDIHPMFRRVARNGEWPVVESIIVMHLLGQAPEGWLTSPDSRSDARSGMGALGSPTRASQILDPMKQDSH
jgi:hypothetical protein